ncbi:SLAM family member 6-like [Aquarana catesbeiana]|uniref:SLAM family member 6-like n=1 Tax=Aquarana catesbeiana TaxID=8400 RepID=UPI003CC95007
MKYYYSLSDVMSEAPIIKKDVLGAVGGAVTLHLCDTGATYIIWNFVKRGKAIGRTKPQESPEIYHNEYKGRLSSTSDGSLIITELRLDDQGIYRTQSLDTETKTCDYHLTVFSNLTAENVTINSNVTDNKTCEVSLTCLVDSVDGRNMTIIWRSLNSSNVTQTENIVFVPPSNINFTYICTAMNPVSNVSKNVVPWLYCNNGMDRENTPKEDYSMVNLIRLVISGCVLLISCCIFIHHMKTEVITHPPETGAI